MVCDGWEPLDFYVIAARSLIPGYNFSLRVIYVDVQSMLAPFTEVYGNDGQFWRACVQQLKTATDRPLPNAVESVCPGGVGFIGGLPFFDIANFIAQGR
jgi:hypothetical protein